jgi:hypothetical protein
VHRTSGASEAVRDGAAVYASSKLSYCQPRRKLLATKRNTETALGAMSLFRDFVHLLAVVDFVVVESLPACRHAGFSVTRGGIVPVSCTSSTIGYPHHCSAGLSCVTVLLTRPHASFRFQCLNINVNCASKPLCYSDLLTLCFGTYISLLRQTGYSTDLTYPTQEVSHRSSKPVTVPHDAEV